MTGEDKMDGLSLCLQSSAVEQVLDIEMDILSLEIAEVVFPCLPHDLWSTLQLWKCR